MIRAALVLSIFVLTPVMAFAAPVRQEPQPWLARSTDYEEEMEAEKAILKHDRELALQLPFLKISESMRNHDSKIVGAGGVD
jgi:hypothetical protein